MNKLISNNPVLRFKLGRKIVKAYGGLDDTFKLLSDTAERSAEREQYWAEEEARKARAAYDRQMKSNNSPKFYGLTVGGKVLARGSNFGDLINDSLKQALLNAGFKNEDFTNVRSFLNALNNFFSKDGAGSIKSDNMWGDQTLKAFNMALSKAGYDPSNKRALTPTTISNIYNLDRLKGLYASGLLKKPELPTIPQEGISNFTPLSTAKTYNKADIRNYIRSKGKGAYDFTGSQRKALRMVMNGQGTDEDKAIVKAMGLFKKGGQLSSRNIIERFKNRNFRLVGQ